MLSRLLLNCRLSQSQEPTATTTAMTRSWKAQASVRTSRHGGGLAATMARLVVVNSAVRRGVLQAAVGPQGVDAPLEADALGQVAVEDLAVVADLADDL